MTSRDNEEQLFSEDIEKLLHGQEPAGLSADADYMDMLLFARRLITMREEPSASFTVRLKRRLSDDMLAQTEAARGHEPWFVRLFSRPGLRLALVSAFMILAAVGLIWRAGFPCGSPACPEDAALPGVLSVPPAPSVPATANDGPSIPRAASGIQNTVDAGNSIAVTAHTAAAIPAGESVNITIAFDNHSTVGCELAPFPPAVVIREATTGWIVRTYASGTGTYLLSAFESARYDMAWDQRDDDGALVDPGSYKIDMESIQLRQEKGEVIALAGASAAAKFDILAPPP